MSIKATVKDTFTGETTGYSFDTQLEAWHFKLRTEAFDSALEVTVEQQQEDEVEIIKSDDTAVYEAVVTVAADRAPRAVELAENELSRECRKLGKVASVLQYTIESRTELAGQGGYEYVIRFGGYED